MRAANILQAIEALQAAEQCIAELRATNARVELLHMIQAAVSGLLKPADTKRREPGTPIFRPIPHDAAQLEYAGGVARRKQLSQEQWCALLDWLDWLQAEAPKHTAEEMRAALDVARRRFEERAGRCEFSVDKGAYMCELEKGHAGPCGSLPNNQP